MKKIFSFLFGELGTIIVAILMAVISWYLFPVFMDICQGTHTLSNVIGYIFVCPFALGFYISGVANTLGLMSKSLTNKDHSKFTKWTLFVISLLLLIFYVALLIINLK